MATTNPTANLPNTVHARILPGWMSHQDAINYLTNECVPPITVQDAEEIWRQYRQRVEALADNRIVTPQYLPMNTQESTHANNFMQFLNTRGPHQVSRVVKIGLRDLVLTQYNVVTDRCDDYCHRTTTPAEWLNEFLPLTVLPAETQARFSLGPPASPHPLSSHIEIDIPHGEFALLPLQTDQGLMVFGAAQFMRHVTGCETQNRLLLKAGYHRTYARILSAPTATVPTALIALELNTCVPPANQPPAVPGETTGTADLTPFGCRAALFLDFFTEGLFMDVLLKRKRYQLLVKSTWLALDV
jgi:hypothetical protein